MNQSSPKQIWRDKSHLLPNSKGICDKIGNNASSIKTGTIEDLIIRFETKALCAFQKVDNTLCAPYLLQDAMRDKHELLSLLKQIESRLRDERIDCLSLDGELSEESINAMKREESMLEQEEHRQRANAREVTDIFSNFLIKARAQKAGNIMFDDDSPDEDVPYTLDRLPDISKAL